MAPASLTLLGDLQDLLPALDRAGPGDDADVAAADLQAQHFDDGRLLLTSVLAIL